VPHYELMLIVRPDAEQEVVDTVTDRIENFIRQENGTVLDCEILGRKRLAYKVKKHHEGIYVKINFQAPPASIARMKANIQLSEDIIRHLIVRTPTFIPTDDIEVREADERTIRETAEPAETEETTPGEAGPVEDGPEMGTTVAASSVAEPVRDFGEEESPAERIDE